MGRGLRQGSAESMLLSAQTLAAAVEPLMMSWKEWRRGCLIGPVRLALAGFADDLLLMASSLVQIRDMLKELASELAKIGLLIKFSKCAWAYTAADESDLEAVALSPEGAPIENCQDFNLFESIVSGSCSQCCFGARRTGPPL